MNRIKELRKEKGLTLRELEAATGLSNNALSQYETGKREPKIKIWKKIAKALDVSTSYLIGLDDSESEYRKEKIAKLEETDLSIFYIDGSGPLYITGNIQELFLKMLKGQPFIVDDAGDKYIINPNAVKCVKEGWN